MREREREKRVNDMEAERGTQCRDEPGCGHFLVPLLTLDFSHLIMDKFCVRLHHVAYTGCCVPGISQSSRHAESHCTIPCAYGLPLLISKHFFTL